MLPCQPVIVSAFANMWTPDRKGLSVRVVAENATATGAVTYGAMEGGPNVIAGQMPVGSLSANPRWQKMTVSVSALVIPTAASPKLVLEVKSANPGDQKLFLMDGAWLSYSPTLLSTP